MMVYNHLCNQDLHYSSSSAKGLSIWHTTTQPEFRDLQQFVANSQLCSSPYIPPLFQRREFDAKTNKVDHPINGSNDVCDCLAGGGTEAKG